VRRARALAEVLDGCKVRALLAKGEEEFDAFLSKVL